MATSLAQQLKRLAVPETGAYKQDKKKTSILFDPKEAASIDRETFYEIGLSGLEELKAIDPRFAAFEKNLFNISSKNFERSTQTSETNEKIDETIRCFLISLSPYFLLQASHKALEWIINRYHIHKYNKDEFMSLILPYHETKIFVRCLQILKVDNSTDRWNWLEPLQKPGVPLPKSAVFNHCSSNPSFLKFIWNIVKKSLQVFQNQPEVLTTLYSFYCSSTVGTLEHTTNISEAHITNILPGLLHTLTSTVEDLKAAGYIILAQLLSKVQLKSKVLKRLVSSILSSDVNIEYETVLILHLLFHTQENLTKVSETFLNNLSVPCMKNLCLNLSLLIAEQTDISRFLVAFMSGTLELLQQNVENMKRFNRLAEMLISEVKFDSKTAELLIKCTVDSYSIKKQSTQDNGDDSDMEVVDEPDIEKMSLWYSNFLKNLESKYPNEFDIVLKNELKQGENETKKGISEIIGFAPKLVDKLGDTFLFEKLYHQNASVRLEACKYLVDNFTKLSKKNIVFLRESITDRLQDEDPTIVSTLLSIDLESLFDLIEVSQIIDILKQIVSKGPKDYSWRTAVSMSLNYICLLEAHVTDVSLIVCILPFLFPNDEDSLIFTRAVLQSYFMDEFIPSEVTKKCLENNDPSYISRTIFEHLSQSEFLRRSEKDLKRILYDSFKENNCKYKVMALVVFSFSLEKREEALNTNESVKLLNDVNKYIECAHVTYKGQYSNVSSKSISKVLDTADDGKFPLQVYTLFLSYLIRNTDITCSYYKPWVLNTAIDIDAKFISTVYEIILKGCGEKLSHIYSPLLEVLVHSILVSNNPQDHVEVIANYVIRSLTEVDTNDKLFNESNMVTVRSLRLVLHLITSSHQDVSWILTSDVLIMMILLALYSDIQCVRENTMEIIKIVGNKCDKKHFITSLFNELFSRQQEIILDHEQVPLILYNLLSPDNSANKLLLKTLKTPMKKSLDYIINTIVNESTPFYVKYKMCYILNHVNSGSILTSLSNITLTFFNYYESGVRKIYNVYESLTLSNIISRVNSKTLKSSIENENVWDMITKSLKYHDFSIQTSNNSFIDITVLMMQQIDQPLFSILSHQHAEKVIALVIEAATFSKNTNVITTSTKLLKRLELNDKHVSLILQAMLSVCESSNAGTRKRKSFVPPLSVLETSEWKCGNTLLECIQNKKKLSGLDRILPLLFKVLKKCLEFEEQSPVEYTKQLVLTSVLHCCQQLYPMDGSQSKPVQSGLIDVELIVMCIRGSQNPQTHHHALMLLSQAAYMIPNKVLHHIMAIFTFIGSSILRHDDAYSFQIITRIIDTVIPILVKSEHGTMDEKKLQELEKRVVPVLRIFVDVALDIPEHRRLPLFKKLLETLNPEHFLWNFLCLLFESHIVHNHEDKKIISNDKKSLSKEQPIRRLDFAMSVTHEFSLDVIMQSCIRLMSYLKSLPIDKPEEDSVKVDSNPSVIFSVSSHTAKELRHFKYTIVTYINSLLSSPIFTQKLNTFSNKNEMENLYKTLIVSILTYIQVVSKAADQNVGKPQGKYWKVMLHHSYEILDNVNAHLPADMFVIVVRGLMSHNLPTVRRKSMEILNTKLQHHTSFFADCEVEIMYSLLEPLVDIISEIDKENITDGFNKQEVELNQQTALLSMKLLVRLLAQENPEKFQSLLDIITNLVRSNVSGNLMASIVLCLAELCSNLKAHAIAYLPKFMPPLIKLLKTQNTSASSELVLLSIITAVYKIVEILPQFLSPYLEKLLYEFSILTAKWDGNDLQKKNTAVTTKLVSIRNKISSTIAPRVLIPVVSQCYSQLIRKGKLSAIGPAMQVLAESFAGISSQEFTSLQQELTAFFLIALQFRNDYENELSEDSVNDIEDHVIKALVSLILKLSESSFRPLYFKIYDWAVRLNNEDNKERTITFYRLSSVIAENLKGLFILFAGHFIKNAADLLDKCNKTKNTDTFFESEDKCCILVESIVKTLHPVFQYDSQNFVNKERFETIMQPLVDQLDNDVGGMESLKTRAKSLLIPCIAQFGIATADDSLWKPLNYQILLKTRHNDSNIRLLGLECMCEMATKLGESWLPLLPESVPFLAELLEDEVKEVETATQKVVQTLEAVLGEPLQKYF